MERHWRRCRATPSACKLQWNSCMRNMPGPPARVPRAAAHANACETRSLQPVHGKPQRKRKQIRRHQGPKALGSGRPLALDRECLLEVEAAAETGAAQEEEAEAQEEDGHSQLKEARPRGLCLRKR